MIHSYAIIKVEVYQLGLLVPRHYGLLSPFHNNDFPAPASRQNFIALL
jgi:hypothetical protein